MRSRSTRTAINIAILCGSAVALVGVGYIYHPSAFSESPEEPAHEKSRAEIRAELESAGLTPEDYGLALSRAAAQGDINRLRDLISAGADVNAKDANGISALQLSVQGKHRECTRLLLQAGADIDRNLQELISRGGELSTGSTSRNRIISDEKLLQAAKNGDIATLRQRLQAGANVHSIGLYNHTPLILAAQGGHAECMQLLLEKGADVKDRNYGGSTALHEAARSGSTACVELLLQAGAEVSARDCGVSPLCEAVSHNHPEIVKLLLAAGANVNDREQMDQSVLYIAVKSDSVDCMPLLIEAGADINIEIEGESLLMVAAKSGNARCIPLLVKLGAPTDQQDRSGSTPLHLAAEKGHTDCVIALLESGADPNSTDLRRATPLHTATRANYPDIVAALLERGADVTLRTTEGLTALLDSVLSGQTDITALLLQHKAPTNDTLPNGDSPLHIAAANRHAAIIRDLLANGADATALNSDGLTPLRLIDPSEKSECSPLLAAAMLRQAGTEDDYQSALFRSITDSDSERLTLLLLAGADPNLRDAEGRSPLEIAAAAGSTECLRALIEAGARLNDKSPQGLRPIHIATEGGHTDCVRALILAGADFSSEDEKKRTPLKIAQNAGHENCTELLTAASDLAREHIHPSDYQNSLISTIKEGQQATLVNLLRVGVDLTDDSSGNALREAILANRPECVSVLLQAGADPNVKASDSTHLLHTAAETGQVDSLRLLLDNGAVYTPERNIPSPLYTACRQGHLECVRLLIDRGYPLDETDTMGRSLLYWTVQKNYPQCLRALLEKGADPKVETGSQTLLHIAAINGNAECMQILLTTSIDVNACDRQNETALTYAASNGLAFCVHMLINAKADVHHRNNAGRTALHAAARSGDIETVTYLLNANASPFLKDISNKLPRYYAESNGHTECAKLLQQAEQSRSFTF